MADSIVLDEGESFNDEKNEQEMDESISSEEEVDSPNKDPISSQLKQSLTEEMNQEREITDKAQDCFVSGIHCSVFSVSSSVLEKSSMLCSKI
jgi:hypothetical protein